MTSPLAAYDALIATGEIAADAAQAAAVARLDALSAALEDHARGRSRGLLGFACAHTAERSTGVARALMYSDRANPQHSVDF